MNFDESKHPRADDGKFTDGSGQSNRTKREESERIYSDDSENDVIPKTSISSKQDKNTKLSAKSSTLDITDLERQHMRTGILLARNMLDREYDKLDSKEDLTPQEVERLDNMRQTLILYDGIIKKLEAKS